MISPRTSPTFERSLAAAHALQSAERTSPKLNPACFSILLEHGHRTDRAVALMHGITSSPVQFHELGKRFFARGYNVFIPRMPRHGFADRLTNDPANLTVAEFKAFGTQSVDIARGLGEHLTVAGLSVSGVVSAWCAQSRPDIDLAVLIAPAFAPHVAPFRLVPAVTWLAKHLPNFFFWWDLARRASVGSACTYPRFSTHAMAESFQLGQEIYHAARLSPLASRHILAITNPRDMAVNNAATAAVLRRWRQYDTTDIREYTFGSELGPLHDIIGPYQPTAQIDYVYPILLNLIDPTP